MKVRVDPELLQLSRSGKDTEKTKRVHDFFLALAACNTIVPIVFDDASDPTVKLMDYQGESPDEQALAYAAAAYGFMLVERTSGHIVIDIKGERQRCFSYSLSFFHILPLFFFFTSSLYFYFQLNERTMINTVMTTIMLPAKLMCEWCSSCL